MNQHPRLRDTEETARAGQLLADGVEGLDRPWSTLARARLAEKLDHKLQQERWHRPLVPWLAVAASALVVAGATLLWTRAHSAGSGPDGLHVVALGQEATLEVASEGDIDLPAPSPGAEGRRVVLKSGKVCAEVAHRDLPRQGPLIVEAPNLRVVVIGTHFCVTTENGLSRVSVTQGRVRAERPAGASVLVAAGETVRSDDVRLAPSAPTVPAEAPALAPSAVPREAPPATPACAEAQTIDARRACYTRVARRTDIAAENALYALGFLERDEAHDGPAALAVWRSYEVRYPKGVFAPEASLGALSELLSEKRYAEALSEADHYLQNNEDETRERVELVRAQLLLGPVSRPGEALSPLKRLAESKDPALREEALFTLGRCELALERRDQATATFQRSLKEYPAGAHAAELRSWAP